MCRATTATRSRASCSRAIFRSCRWCRRRSAAAIRADLEATLTHLTTGATSAEIVDALWHTQGTIADLVTQSRFEGNERDVPIAKVVGNVLAWARGALSA